MTIRITYCCDGQRHEQPCKGWLPTSSDRDWVAAIDAEQAGWRTMWGASGDLCPSHDHDEEDEADKR